jgi:hypothetical protein
LDELEKRVGPEGRKLFEKFLRQVNKLQAQQRLEAQARTVGVGWAKSPVADRDGQSAIVRDASDDDPADTQGAAELWDASLRCVRPKSEHG